MKNLHRIHPYETHRIGVVYVAPGQSSETEILANTFGSSRYLEFLRGLGSLLRLPDVPRRLVYLGGLDQSGTDGKVTYCYHDNISQVLFHVATLMPTDLTSDPKCSCKKLHIGNDFVTIVYNDSGSKYKFGTIKVHTHLVCSCMYYNYTYFPLRTFDIILSILFFCSPPPHTISRVSSTLQRWWWSLVQGVCP